MSTVLFKLFGFNVTGKLLAYLGGFAVLAFLAWSAIDRVQDHFRNIKELKQANENLTEEKRALNKEVEDLTKLNEENRRFTDSIIKQRDAAVAIADEEEKSTATRNQKYKEIKDAIPSKPSASDPVSPVVTDTLGQLWEQGSN